VFSRDLSQYDRLDWVNVTGGWKKYFMQDEQLAREAVDSGLDNCREKYRPGLSGLDLHKPFRP
jgi:hypothetical protein